MARRPAGLPGRDLGSATLAVERAVAGLVRPSSVRVELGGQSESQKTAFRNLMVVFGLGAGLVFLLLVLSYLAIMAVKLSRIEREVVEIAEIVEARDRSSQATPARSKEPVA